MKKLLFYLVFFTTAFGSDLFAENKIYTLEDCREMALTANKSIKISHEKILAARELKKATFTHFLPSFNATASYLWNQKNLSLLAEDAHLPIGSIGADGSFGFRQDQVNNKWTQMPDGSYVPLDKDGKPFNPKLNPEKIQWKDYALMPKESMEFDIHNIFAGGIGFTQPIYLGGKIRELYKISQSNEKISELKHIDEINSLIVEVDEAYWRVVSLENKTKLAKEYCNLLEKLEKNLEDMFSEGVATKADILKVKVKLNEAEMIYTKAENGLNLSKMALCQLCGFNINSNISLFDTELIQQNIKTPEINMSEAIENRIETKLLNEAQNIANSNVNIMKSNFLPSVILSGNYIISNPSMYNGVSKTFGGMFSVGVGVSIPIYHFGERRNTLNIAKSQQKIAEYQLEEAKEKIQLQINQSEYRVLEANKKLVMTENNMKKAEENLKYANAAFEEGLLNSTELLEAQNAWLTANSEKIDANIDARLCELYLKRAIGINISK